MERIVKKGRIQQSVSRWCYGKLSLDELCEASAQMGLVGIDLLGPDDFPTLKKHNLVCTMTSGGGAVNDKAKHEQAVRGFAPRSKPTPNMALPTSLSCPATEMESRMT